MKKFGIMGTTLSIAMAFALTGCGDDDSTPSSENTDEIEIEGSWSSNFGGTEDISSTSWSGSQITTFDNEENFAVTQSPDDSQYNPGKYNRNVWTEPADGVFFYCTVDFGLDSEADALATTADADASDPENGGCGGFSWTQLSSAR